MKQDDKFLLALKELIKTLVIAIVSVIILTQFFLLPVKVEGSSMYPTLEDHDIGFANIISRNMGGIDRFDVVVVKFEAENKNIVKRVIGLPGDTISIKDDVLYVNGQAIEESFLDTEYVKDYKDDNNRFTSDIEEISVPEGHYYVLGDNRPNSKDSRQYGTFKASEIKSKSVYVIFPFNNLGRVGK